MTLIRVAHSPDSDDAFMFYALANNLIDTGDLQFEHVLSDIETLNREAYTMEKDTAGWQSLPFWLKCWFFLNFLSVRTTRIVATRIQLLSHLFGFLFCALGFVSEAALAGGIILLVNAYLFSLLKWQGDKYGIWYDADDSATA